MRILFVTPQTYPPQSAGGSLSSTHELCLLLRERGHDVAVACGFGRRGWLGAWIRARRKLRPARRFPRDSLMGYPTYRGWNPLDGLGEVVDDFRPDIAIAQAGSTALAAQRLADLRLPTLAYVRDVEFDKMGATPTRHPLVRYVANSGFTASSFEAAFGWRPAVVPPIVIPQRYATTATRRAVVHVNPFPQKGIDITLELARRRPDIPFVIVESWTINQAIREQYQAPAKALRNVTWRKMVRDMREIYALARVVIAPSRAREAWGRVATEAQLSGIPVLASRRGGLPEAVGPGGLLVDADAPLDEWEQALSALWDDADRYRQLSEAARVHSQRYEIQPEALLASLEAEIRKVQRGEI